MFKKFIEFNNELNEKQHPMIGGTINVDNIDYTIEDVEPRSNFDVYIIKGGRKFMSTKVQATPPVKIATKKQSSNSSWNKTRYNKWIKDSASGGGANNAWDMAKNAKYENGLIDYVKKEIKKNYGSETPLERIQWDIESYAR